ncbi:MAG: type II secretion system F family protein [Candidatus Nanohaloarchaea archaeon]
MLDEYAEFCFDQAGPYVLDYVPYFEDLRPQLTKSGLEISLPEYVSMMVFSAGVMSLLSFVFFGIMFVMGMGVAGILLALVLSIVSLAATFVGFYLYPVLMVRNRASKIRDTLPFATMYLSTLAGTGTSLPEIFGNLADTEEYGEVSKEAEKIHRDIETFGMDSSKAMERAAERTPSKDFRELVWGINHVLTTGGSLREFLRERASSLMTDYQRRVEEFSDSLSLIVEMYITVVIVGSIIFTSMSAVMSSFANFDPGTIVAVQAVAIFFGLPIISGMFILLIKGISPGGIR